MRPVASRYGRRKKIGAMPPGVMEGRAMTLVDYFVTNTQLKLEWAADRNTLQPEDMASHSRERVWWRCAKGHEWQASVDSRVWNAESWN